MRQFLHLLWWRVRLRKWYFLLLLAVAMFHVLAFAPWLVWGTFMIACLLAAASANIVYFPDYTSATPDYLSTRPIRWRPLFWSRCIPGLLFCFFPSILIHFSLFMNREDILEIGYILPVLLAPTFAGIFFWSAGGITISRNKDIGQTSGIVLFGFVILTYIGLSLLYWVPRITYFPEGIVRRLEFSFHPLIIINVAVFTTFLFSFGLFAIVDRSMFRRGISIPFSALIFIAVAFFFSFLGFHRVSFNGTTACYEFENKQIYKILGHTREDKNLIFVAKTKDDKNQLFRLDLADPTALPAAICVVGATWDSSRARSSIGFPGMPGMMPGMMSEVMPGMATDEIGEVTAEQPAQPDVLTSNPYEKAIVEKDRILLFGSSDYELLAFDGERCAPVIPRVTCERSIAGFTWKTTDEVSFYLSSYHEGQNGLRYQWQDLNLRTGELGSISDATYPFYPWYEIEVGDRRYRIDILSETWPPPLFIEDRSRPSGAKKMGELPRMFPCVVTETQVAGFVRHSTHWTSWELRLYNVRDPAAPTYVEIDVPFQFHDPATLAQRYLDSWGTQISRLYFNPLFAATALEPTLRLGGGYLAYINNERIAIWDVSNSDRPVLLGTAPFIDGSDHFYLFHDASSVSQFLYPRFGIQGPTTPIERSDGALGYLYGLRRIQWFKMAESQRRGEEP